MTVNRVVAPRDTWTVAIYRDATATAPVGTGVVIDRHRILTCAHLLQCENGWREQIWVTFPKAQTDFTERHRVTAFTTDYPSNGLDLAVLTLPAPAPAAVNPAPLLCLAPEIVTDLDWWAFGFPLGAGDAGDFAAGRISAPLAWGKVKLDAGPGSRLESGFSGSGVWSPEYEAVVGLVVTAGTGVPHHGNGHALTLHRAHQSMPELRLGALAQPGPAAVDLPAWGWRLHDDPERGQHWEPRGRGLLNGAEGGCRFRGRATALTEIVSWLDRPDPDGRMLVVTGSPGVGKSAVLGRIVTTADPELRRQLPPDDHGVKARDGSVACAVHAKGKTAREVAIEIARAASLPLPELPEKLVPSLRARLTDRRRAGAGRRFNLIVDALDEAASPAEARRLLDAVLLPLTTDESDVDAQVLIGTRRQAAGGDLLASIEKHAQVIDLDHPDYIQAADLAAYAEATLRLAATASPGSPYADPAVATPVAHQIAALAEGNFLIAGLLARAHGKHNHAPASPDQVTLAPTVDAALDAYLLGQAAACATPLRLALTVLAYAEPPGLPLPLWQAGVVALGGQTTEAELADLARQSAANFLVETNTGPTVRAYRLLHQALADALRRGRAGSSSPRSSRATADGHEHHDQQRLFDAWLRIGKGTGWSQAYDYLHRSLPAHAAPIGRIDELLNDDRYLLHADLRRLAPAAEHARTDQGRARLRLLQLTPLAFDARPAQRAAMFSVTEQLDRLGSGFQATAGAPYRARWAHTPPRAERTALAGHADRVLGVTAVATNGRHLLASAGEDGTVRLWDPATGQPGRVLTGHTAAVRVVCAVPVGPVGPLPANPPQLLASAGEDHTVRLWHPVTGHCERSLEGHTDWVRGACAIQINGADLLATASDDHTVRLWDPTSGHCVRVLTGHAGWVSAVAPVAGGRWLASAGYDPAIRLWDPATGALVKTVAAPSAWVTALCPVQAGGRELLAVGGYDPVIRLVDPATGDAGWELPVGPGPVTGLATVTLAGTCLLAVATAAGPVWLWDPATGRQVRGFEGHIGGVGGACPVPAAGRDLLATAGDDGTVRLWDPATGRPGPVLDQVGPVTGLGAVSSNGTTWLASTGRDGAVRLWDPTSGRQVRRLAGHTAPVTSACPVTVAGAGLLATAGEDRTVRLWHPGAGRAIRVLTEEHPIVTAICAVPEAGTTPAGPDTATATGTGTGTGTDRIAVASDTLRLWHPETRQVERVLGHLRWVTAVCLVPVPGGRLLASSDEDGTVRLWDPADGSLLRELRSHHGAATALCAVPVGDQHLLASASADRTVLLWDPRTGARTGVLAGHTDRVTGLCVVPTGGRHLLASTSTDRSVRLWNPATSQLELSIPVHHPALACWAGAGSLVIGLDAGLLTVALEPDRRRPTGHRQST